MFKKLLSMVAIAGMVMTTSCSSDEFEPAQNGGEAVVSFTTELPSSLQSRAFGDGTTAKNLSYFVYDAEWNYLEALSAEDGEKMNGLTATVNLQLVNGETYNVVFWADAENAPYTFNTNDATVAMNYDNAAANDENRDAFYKVENFTVNGNMTRKVELKRPFSQINIGTTDWAEVVKTTDAITQTGVVVKGVFSELSLRNGVASTEVEVTFDLADMPAEGETFPAENAGVDKYLAMNYILAGTEKQLVDVTINYNGDVQSRKFTSVPVQRNYRTNIFGKLLTSDNDFNVEIKPEFDGELPEAGNLAEQLKMAAQTNGTFTLNENLDFTDSTVTKDPYLNVWADFTFNISDDVTFTSGDAGNYGIIVRQGTTTINSQGHISSKGGGLGVANGAKLIYNGGSLDINTTSTSGRYLFYAVGEGSTIEINSGSFDFNRSQNQKRAYIYAEEGTEVYVKGGTFGKASTRSGYTTGIMGPGKVVITGGTFGFDPTTWVAEGYSAVKDGSNWVVLKGEVTVASTLNELKSALEAGGTIYMTEDITLNETLRVLGGVEVVLNMNGKTFTLEDGQDVGTVQGMFVTSFDSKLTIEGNGTFNVGNNGSGFLLPAGSVTIENGTFLRDLTGIDLDNAYPLISGYSWKYHDQLGDVVINGGYFDGGYYDTAANNLFDGFVETHAAGQNKPGDTNAIRVAVKNNVTALINLSDPGNFEVFGGTFVGANPAWDDEGAMLPTNYNGNYLRPWSYYQGGYFPGQVFNENQIVLPAGYEVTEGATPENIPTYTVTYNK